jgi:putative heme iron utilization protein
MVLQHHENIGSIQDFLVSELQPFLSLFRRTLQAAYSDDGDGPVLFQGLA